MNRIKNRISRMLAFIRMLKTAKKINYSLNYLNLIIGFFSIMYFIFPLDFIPEIAFGPFGLIDDVGILMFGIKFLNKEISNFINWENSLKIIQPK